MSTSPLLTSTTVNVQYQSTSDTISQPPKQEGIDCRTASLGIGLLVGTGAGIAGVVGNSSATCATSSLAMAGTIAGIVIPFGIAVFFGVKWYRERSDNQRRIHLLSQQLLIRPNEEAVRKEREAFSEEKKKFEKEKSEFLHAAMKESNALGKIMDRLNSPASVNSVSSPNSPLSPDLQPTNANAIGHAAAHTPVKK